MTDRQHPRPAVIAWPIVEHAADARVEIMTFRADKAPAIVVPAGRCCRMFVIAGMLRLEDGHGEPTLTETAEAHLTPGTYRLCPLVHKGVDPQTAGATVLVVEYDA
jgi:hypothetical protein